MKESSYTRFICRVFVVLTLVMMYAHPSHALLTGETITINRLIPPGFNYNASVGQSGAYTVGSSSPLSLSGGNNLFASATDKDLILSFGPNSGSGGNIANQYIIFSDLFNGTTISITGFSIVTNTVPGLALDDITFDAHSVKVFEGGANWSGGQLLDIALQTTSPSPVPVPSTFILIGPGITCLAFLKRRKFFRL